VVAGKWDASVRQGEQWVRYVDVTDSAGAPVALTTPATLDVRVSAGTTARIARLSDSGGQIVLAANRATLTLTAAVTLALPAGRYVYDLFAGDAGGKPVALLAGSFTVVPRVTRPEQV
jgi:hypothetical protein